ncbi:hypothetical protein HOY80DRAFT_1022405 [Tuber brumale]|nr:hypothetical protein HOY80DRAFT_1022405 [Tuber brumale]
MSMHNRHSTVNWREGVQIIVHVDTTTGSLMNARMKHTHLAWIPLHIELQDLEAGFDKGCLGVGFGLSLWVTGWMKHGEKSPPLYSFEDSISFNGSFHDGCGACYNVQLQSELGNEFLQEAGATSITKFVAALTLVALGVAAGNQLSAVMVAVVVVQVVVDRATAVAAAVATVNGVAVGIMEAMVNVLGVERAYLKENGYNPLEMIHFPDMLRSELEEIKTKIFLIVLEKLHYSIQRLKNPGNSSLPLWSLCTGSSGLRIKPPPQLSPSFD